MEDIPKFKTPESYEQFAINVQERSPERAREAIRRAIELRAEQRGAKTVVERDALEAIYAYERMLWIKHGKKVGANYTWRSVKDHGILGAVERAVKKETVGYRLLVENGLEDKAFEAVILRHPESFSAEAVATSKARIEQLKTAQQP